MIHLSIRVRLLCLTKNFYFDDGHKRPTDRRVSRYTTLTKFQIYFKTHRNVMCHPKIIAAVKKKKKILNSIIFCQIYTKIITRMKFVRLNTRG